MLERKEKNLGSVDRHIDPLLCRLHARFEKRLNKVGALDAEDVGNLIGDYNQKKKKVSKINTKRWPYMKHRQFEPSRRACSG